MNVTRSTIADVYALLRNLTPQFKRLPAPAEIEFHVTRHQDRYGDYSQWQGTRGDRHIIRISAEKHAHLLTVMQTVAHEMVHLAQSIDGSETKAVHNADFRRRARAVCKLFGWDEKAF